MKVERSLTSIVFADLALAAFVGDRHFANFLATLDNRLLKIIGALGIGPAIFGHIPIEYRMFTVHCSTAELPRNARRIIPIEAKRYKTCLFLAK